MEQRFWRACRELINDDKLLSREALASLRSLIVNPHTSNSTISSVLVTLTRSLQLSSDPLLHHHTLKLLTDLASHRPRLSSLIFDLISSNSLLSAGSPLLAGNSIAALASISGQERNLRRQLDDALFVSLCFCQSVSLRLWLLRNAERLGVGPHVLLTVFLGFTKDPYPYVRQAALEGLSGLCKYNNVQNAAVILGCYNRAVDLLQEAEVGVRTAAVRVVSGWGQMLVAASEDNDKTDLANAVFLQLCSMARDMNVSARVEAFNSLGKLQMLSEDVLLQTLSKKVLWIMREKKPYGQYTEKMFKILVSSAAGVFIHGLEDEFYEVRKSACCSLRMLANLSAEFSSQALNILINLVNDNFMDVRIEAIETLHHMATLEYKVGDAHMRMFLGTLADNSDLIRSAARKVYKLLKLPSFELFKLSVHGLLDNLEAHPQDEADVFSVLFHMSRNHGKFAARFVKEVSAEIEPVFKGKLSLDSTKVAAFLVLSISAPLSCNQHGNSIPPRFFSYAVTYLGRISHALTDVVDQPTLLAYLLHCSRSCDPSDIKFPREELLFPLSNDVPIHTSKICSVPVGIPCFRTVKTSEVQSLLSHGSRDTATSLLECQLSENDGIRNSTNIFFSKIKEIWPLVQSRFNEEVLRTLRVCEEELSLFAPASLDAGVLPFTLQYLRAIKILAKVWKHMFREGGSDKMGKMEILLGKVDSLLREMRCRFIGLTNQDEFQVVELMLVACILRLSRVQTSCRQTMKKLYAIVSRAEFLCLDGSVEPSDFVLEVKKTIHEWGTCTGVPSYSTFQFAKLANLFSPKQFSLCGLVKHKNAELNVPDNDSENPLPFVSGLPVVIPLEITLHNVLNENRLWLRFSLGEESMQFVFLDLSLFDDCGEVKKFRFTVPFYRTPKAGSFTLGVCIGMECSFEKDEVYLVKGCGGPKHPLAYLCQEKKVHLCMIC